MQRKNSLKKNTYKVQKQHDKSIYLHWHSYTEAKTFWFWLIRIKFACIHLAMRLAFLHVNIHEMDFRWKAIFDNEIKSS